MKPISVILADDHAIVRAGLRALLDLESDLEIVGEADNGREAVVLARDLIPDVIVMDISMPRLNGFEATKQIIETGSASRVLVLSSHSEMSYLALAAEAGAAGYLLKEDAARSLPEAIRWLHVGKAFLSPHVLSSAELKEQRRGARGHLFKTRLNLNLTSREMEVLQLIAEGMSNKEMAAELGVSIKTIEKHRQNVMEKLDIHHAAGLTRYAIASGIIECGLKLSTT